MSPADAATILDHAQALVASERLRAVSDQSDESRREDAPSVAFIACVADPLGETGPSALLLRSVLDNYLAGTSRLTLNLGFASWAAAAGFARADCRDIAVALDKSGRGVAAMDLRPHGARRSTQRGHSTGRGPRNAHMHGFTRVDGAWRCEQDYSAIGIAPETGCGQTCDTSDQT